MSEDIMNIGFNSLNIDIEGEIYEYLKYNDLLKHFGLDNTEPIRNKEKIRRSY